MDDTSAWLGLCPAGKDYITELEADEVDVIWFNYDWREEQDPYVFACDFSSVDDGTYALVVATSDDENVGYIVIQLAMTKNGEELTFDYTDAKLNERPADLPVSAEDNGEDPAEGDPAEYGREYWEEKYPGENVCPFYIEENGTEYSYYWVSGLDGWDGTMESWIDQPFNWNGWHKTADGCIVNEDETLKITDDWANGDESMSSYCTVTTEKYDKDSAGSQNTEASEDWPFADYAKPENCEIDEIEDWGSFTKVYVIWDNKDAAKAYKEALALSGGTTADIDGTFEYNSGEVMISYSETNALANFIMINN